MPKALILGSEGMAGHVISNILNNNTNISLLNINRDNKFNQVNSISFDLHDQEKLITIIQVFKPDFVINAAGLLIQNCENNPHEAIFINSFLPQHLNFLSTKYNFKLIHISTDCVFSGNKEQGAKPYIETDEPDANSIYGKSKILGEINNTHNLTIRTSIIGPELKSNGTGLLHWFLNQHGQIKGFSNAIWSGVTTIELAQFINTIINTANNISGIYHLTNNQSISKYTLLNLIKKIFNLNHISITADLVYSSNKSFINTRNDLNLNYATSSHQDMLLAMRDFIQGNNQLYGHYKINNENLIFNL